MHRHTLSGVASPVSSKARRARERRACAAHRGRGSGRSWWPVEIPQQVEEPSKQIRLAEEIADKQIHGRKARKAIARVVREPERPIEDILEEIIEEPFELPFEVDEKDAILEGSKSQTTRLNAPDRRIKAGSKVYASVIEPRFAELHILSIERKRLKHFGEEDAMAEGSSSLEEFREVWERRYGQWNEDQLVYVIRFERS